MDEKCCRGDWGAPKSEASNATIPVSKGVIDRIQKLKDMTVQVGGGRGGFQTFKVVKSSNPEDLVFQSIRKGAAMSANNVLMRYQACGKETWDSVGELEVPQNLTRDLAQECRHHIKDAQALMRYSKASTTLDINMQTADDWVRIPSLATILWL